MSWYFAGGILEIITGTIFLIAAFHDRWRGFVASLNPFGSKLMVSIICAGIGLVEMCVGVRTLFLIFRSSG
jgi:hypothetical protein